MTGKEGKKEEGEHRKKKGKSYDSFFFLEVKIKWRKVG